MLTDKKNNNLRSAVVAVSALLVCGSGFIAVPYEPLPFVIQNMMILLAAAVFGGIQAGGIAGLFFAAGALGLPVFSQGHGGLKYISDNIQGGFIIGYFIGALITGFFIGTPSPNKKTPIKKIVIGCAAGYLVIYIPGTLHMFDVADNVTGLMDALVPYLMFDGIKCIITIIIAYFLRPVAGRILFND